MWGAGAGGYMVVDRVKTAGGESASLSGAGDLGASPLVRRDREPDPQTRGQARVLERAALNDPRYTISNDERRRLIELLLDEAESANSARARIAAARCIVAADGLNAIRDRADKGLPDDLQTHTVLQFRDAGAFSAALRELQRHHRQPETSRVITVDSGEAGEAVEPAGEAGEAGETRE